MPHDVAPLIQLEDVHFGYGERPVLEGVSLQIPKGKVTALMGASGGGKTTVLRLIGGQYRANAGRVLFDETDIGASGREALYQARRRMGMLFQFGALFTDMSVLDNVAFQMREHTDLPETMIRDLALMKLQAVGLRGAARLMPSELSGGMARRVALARSVALDPMLMLYDEPFTGLDPLSLGVIASLIRRLNEVLGSTSIIVTHDVTEAMDLVDYVYFMSAGRVVAEGTPAQIRSTTDAFVHQFVYGEADGPVPFHYPAPAFRQDLLAESA